MKGTDKYTDINGVIKKIFRSHVTLLDRSKKYLYK